jgi:hypothetical protein
MVEAGPAPGRVEVESGAIETDDADICGQEITRRESR